MKTPKILKVSEEARICHFRSAINYTVLHLENGRTYISGYNIKVFEELNMDDFIKVNRSDLINVKSIKNTTLINKNWMFRLSNGKEVMVSRRRMAELKKNYPNLFKVKY
ncbi:MAG: LytTR family transcriptional regulator [Bacteroidetes bacterium]|nr:LytTR family transcriptional regulator [Bacteroidota bacterium]